MSCLAAFTIALYIVLGNQVNHDLIFLFETLFTGSFWSALISYTSLSMLKLYAIWRPFDYRRTVTMKRCIYLGVVSFPLWKLGVHILTFAGLSIFFIVCCMWNAFSTGCYFQRNYVELMRIRGIVRLILILRICLDPVLSFATDLQLRRCLFETFSVTSEDTSSTLNHSKERKSDTTHAGSKK
ncbi:unnamed protein product, partial [Mesorhabditis belari]|uniref:Uncharacterized protein n=1 Tax=Mesorhabditis belari TaxID=2138241 RepID=A0AAF3ECE3_9BILA